MRGVQAAALLGLLALPAKADIVDSGSLQIGGQGIIGGTMTVQGNALGVAGSVSATSATLSGTGTAVYSLTSSSGIHVINGKIKIDSGGFIEWPDLSKSTTAAVAGGAGDAVLSATQTFSGGQTFAGPVKFSSNVVRGYSVYFSSQYVYNVNCVTFNGLTSSTTYRLRMDAKQQTTTADSHLFWRANNDSGGNYQWVHFGYDTGFGVTANTASGANQAYITAKSVGVGIGSGEQFGGDLLIRSKPGNENVVNVDGNLGSRGSISRPDVSMHWAEYVGGSTFSRFDLCLDGSDAMTGWFTLYAEGGDR